jgi:hypothetical protein
MKDDDSRGNQTPDRRDEPIDYHAHLAALDSQAETLLETIADDTTVDSSTRRAATRHCRELRAALAWVHRLCWPDRDWPDTVSTTGPTTVRGPSDALRAPPLDSTSKTGERDG